MTETVQLMASVSKHTRCTCTLLQRGSCLTVTCCEVSIGNTPVAGPHISSLAVSGGTQCCLGLSNACILLQWLLIISLASWGTRLSLKWLGWALPHALLWTLISSCESIVACRSSDVHSRRLERICTTKAAWGCGGCGGGVSRDCRGEGSGVAQGGGGGGLVWQQEIENHAAGSCRQPHEMHMQTAAGRFLSESTCCKFSECNTSVTGPHISSVVISDGTYAACSDVSTIC